MGDGQPGYNGPCGEDAADFVEIELLAASLFGLAAVTVSGIGAPLTGAPVFYIAAYLQYKCYCGNGYQYVNYCLLHQNRFAMLYITNESTQAIEQLYKNEKRAHFQLPVSFEIVANVAIHGKYSRANTMNDKALAAV